MTRVFHSLLPVVLEALLLFVLSRLLFTGVVSALADRRGKGFLLGLLRLPGNFVHEFSHCLGFWLCGYRVQQVKLCIFDRQGRGCCQPGKAWSPITLPWLAIGLASLMPLLLGSLVLVLTAGLLHLLPEAPPPLATGHLWGGLWTEALALFHRLDWHAWQTYVFLYLALSIGAELSPSSVDLRYGIPALLGLAVGMWLFFFAVYSAPHLHDLAQSATLSVVRGTRWLGSTLALSLIVTATTTALTLLPGLLLRGLRRR